jgi:hypothetical protein
MIDYSISRWLLDNYPNTGTGDYRMNFHLVEYGESNYQNDLELYKIISPSDDDIYSRVNPICNGIGFIIRNNSDNPINNFTINLKNNTAESTQHINLAKPLKSFAFDTVTVYIDKPDF